MDQIKKTRRENDYVLADSSQRNNLFEDFGTFINKLKYDLDCYWIHESNKISNIEQEEFCRQEHNQQSSDEYNSNFEVTSDNDTKENVQDMETT